MQPVSRIGSLLDAARDLTLEAARDASTRSVPTPQIKKTQITKLLDARNEREVLEGLRRVIAMQYSNPPQPTLTFFPSVLKTLSNPYPSTRPLVYNYLLHHAELDPDTALLSINTIQKTLSDSNARVRAMALKTMAGIRVPVISQIVSLAIKKGVSDPSPVVRKVAALACVKCVVLDPSTRPQVEEYIATLLGDKQYYVAGAAVQTFVDVCPGRLDLVHPNYRKLCKMIVDMDEWAQLALLRLLTTYARKCFPRRTKRIKKIASRDDKNEDFYDELEPKEEVTAECDEIDLEDPDLELFLKSIHPLLCSRNSAVTVAVARAYIYLSPNNFLHEAISPLIALLRSPQDIQYIVLYDIVQVCLANPTPFALYFRHFLLRSAEAPHIWRLKLEILTLIFPYCGTEVQELVLAELEYFSSDHTLALVRDCVRAIGRCAQSSDPVTSRRCLSLLMKQIHSADQNLVGEAVEVVRHLIQRSPDEHRKTVVRLAKNLDTLTSPTARASIIWLVGEFLGQDPNDSIAADVLRILVKGYAVETTEVQAQIVLLSAKVYLHFLNAENAKLKASEALSPGGFGLEEISQNLPLAGEKENDFNSDVLGTSTHARESEESREPHTIELLYRHTMLLARYTAAYDLRDRARLFRAVLAVSNSTELASLLLLAPKPVPQAPSPSESRKDFALGSASLVIGSEGGAMGLKGYEPIADWVEEGREPDPKLRDDGADAYAAQRAGPVSAGQMLDQALEADPGYSTHNEKKTEKTLDDWLDDEESSQGEESSEESEDETESEGEDEESEEASESEEDERAELVR